MRRRRILLAIGIAVVVIGCGVLVSSPGQALWLQAKIRYRLIPMLQVNPGGIDPALCIAELDPQWHRLIARGYVSWYHRRFPVPQLDPTANAEFWRRVRSEIPIPSPFTIALDQDLEFQTPRTADSPVIATTITILAPAVHHPRIDALAEELFGRRGIPAPAPPPRFVGLAAYLPARP